MYWVDKFAMEIQNLIAEKNELILEQNSIISSINAGADYFKKNNNSGNNLLRGSERMVELVTKLKDVNSKIRDIDLIIVSKLEAYMSNVVGKLEFKDNQNIAGDYTKRKVVYAVPFISEEDKVQISPDDLYFLKMIKEALNPTNVSFEEKE